MHDRDHVDIWLRAAANIQMPEIGWGNQFGFVTCATYTPVAVAHPFTAADCAAWEQRQVRHRELLERTLERHWRFAPGAAEEQIATQFLKDVLPVWAHYSMRKRKSIHHP